MGRKIEFEFLLSGTETAAGKLKAIEGLAQSISKGTSGSALLRAATSNMSPSTLARNPQLIQQMKDLGKNSGKAFDEGLKSSNSALGAFLNQSMGIGAGQNRPSAAGYAAFWKSALPPVIAPPIIQSSIGGGGNLSNILRATGFGGFGNISKLGLEFAALYAVTNLLRRAFNDLLEAIKRGSKLFIDSAKVGTQPNRLSQLRSALGVIGISESQADILMLNSEFGGMMRAGRSGTVGGQVQGRRGFSGSAAGMTLTAMRGAGQYGEIQQLMNLSKQFEQAWKDAAVDSEIAGKNAKLLFQSNRAIEQLKREWNTLWEQLATSLSTILIPVIDNIKYSLQLVNLIAEGTGLRMLANLAGKLYPDGGDSRFGSNGNSRIPANQFQKMGFVFGGGSFHGDAMQETAKNTKMTAMGVNQLVKILTGVGTTPAAFSWATNP